MKKVGPILGITGASLIAISSIFKNADIAGSSLVYSLGVIVLNIGFFPYLLWREWKNLNSLGKLEHVLGIVGAMFLLNGILFKTLHWPTAQIQMILAVFIFTFGYLPLQLHNQWRKAGTRLQKSYAVIRFATFFTILCGFVFKIQHLPGGFIILAAGTFLLPSYLLFYFILRMKNQGKVPFMVSDLLIAVIAYSIWLFVNSVMISPSAMEGYIMMEDQYIQMNAGIESANNLIFGSIDSLSGNIDASIMVSILELKQLGDQCTTTTDSIKEDFYMSILGGYYKKGSNHYRLGAGTLSEVGEVNEYFIEGENGTHIKETIDHYRERALEIANRYNISSGSIGLGLETADMVSLDGYTQSWVNHSFEDVSASSVIINLSFLKQMVLLTESAVLNAVISQMDLSEETILLQELAARESDRAIQLTKKEIAQVKQQKALQEAQLEQSLMETKQNQMMAIFAFGGVALVLVLFSISTRAYVRKQKDNKKLSEQKDQITKKNEALNHRNEEISSQRDEIEAQRDEIEAQRDMVVKQKEQIEKTHNAISESIDYATRLQESILPNTDLLLEHFADHLVLFRPKLKVSGDFYWWSEVENQVIIAVADCTGHGVPGAFMSMLGVSLLREIVNKEFITQPGVILRRLRKEVIRSLDQKGDIGEQKDGMDMALVTINTDTLKCEYAGANNPIYLVRDQQLTEYKPDRMPISYYFKMGRFTTHEIQLQPGDQIYLFSDGYADQFGGKNRKKYKYKAFKELLIENTGAHMYQQHKALLETIVEWQGDFEQIDDMVILGIRI